MEAAVHDDYGGNGGDDKAAADQVAAADADVGTQVNEAASATATAGQPVGRSVIL